MTGLHWAVIGGQTAVISLLLDRKAPLEIKNEYGGTVLGQAIWSAYNAPKPQNLAIIDTLIAAGAIVNPDWEKYLNELRSQPPRK
jgi:ankyrin repeat protein